MSDRAKRWTLAALSVVLAVVLLRRFGLLVPAFEFVDQHPWIITAAAAFVTAAATVYIARFAHGTLELFRLEKERFESEEAYLQHEAIRIGFALQKVAARMEAVAGFPYEVRSDPERREVLEGELEAARTKLQSLHEEVGTLREKARGGPVEISKLASSMYGLIGNMSLLTPVDANAERLENEANAISSLGEMLILIPMDEENDDGEDYPEMTREVVRERKTRELENAMQTDGEDE